MRIIPHYIYGFKFKHPFNTDTYNGIYKVLAVYSFDEMLLNEIDLFAETYEPLGLTKEDDYFPVLADIKKGKIYKLVKLNEEYEIIFYVPEYLIDGIPDASVKKYYDFGIASHIGIFDDPAKLETLKNDIQDLIAYHTGIKDSTSVVYSIKEAWQPVKDYQELENAREQQLLFLKSGENIAPDEFRLVSSQTYLEQCVRLNNIVTSLKTIIAAYEDTLKLIST